MHTWDPRRRYTRIGVLVLAIGMLTSLLVAPAFTGVAAAAPACPSPAVYTVGSGTALDPWRISTPGHLQYLRDDVSNWDKAFILTQNIDMAGCVWSSGIGYTSPFFKGTLDGGGFVISGLSVSASASANVHAGLVSQMQSPGVITRLGFAGSVSATVLDSGSSRVANAGGLVGNADSGSIISYSYATGNITATAAGHVGQEPRAGGLIGNANFSVNVIDSYATGTAIATGIGDSYAGGLVGRGVSSTISRSYATGFPSAGAGGTGGFLGAQSAVSANGDFWDTTTSTTSTGVPGGLSGITGKTTAQMMTLATYTAASWAIVDGWAPFNAPASVWGICPGFTRAFLLWQYNSSPCPTSPGAPVISGVTPASTTASVAFTADDSGGAPLTRLEFAVDDTQTVDDSTTNLASPFTLTGLVPGSTYVVYMRAVNPVGTGPWSLSSGPFNTLGTPGAPVITGVTPASTTASVAFTADDSGGSAITRLEFALDDTQAVDDSTTSSASPFTLTGLTPGSTHVVYVRAANVVGAGPWSVASAPFTTSVPPAPSPAPPPSPPAPVPPSPPGNVVATAGDGRISVAWQAPASPGTYPVASYEAVASPGGQTCTTTARACTITGLTNGVPYTVTVAALSDAGWSSPSTPSDAVTPRPAPDPSMEIRGLRSGQVISVVGTASDIPPGESLVAWIKLKGQRSFSRGWTRVEVREGGTFSWSRRTSRGCSVYFTTADGLIRSNTVTIPGGRSRP